MAYLRSLRGKGHKGRKALRRSYRRKAIPRGGRWHRPRVKKVGGRFFHTKRSRLFGSRPVRVNGRCRRRNGARRMRLNPFNVKGLLSSITNKAWLMKVAGGAVGIAAGLTGKTLVEMGMDQVKLGQYKKYSGVGGVILGTLIAVMGKKEVYKTMGLAIAGVGAYDLIQQNLASSVLPVINGVNIKGLIPSTAMPSANGSYPVPYLPVSPVSALSSNYPSPATAGYSGSYQAPEMTQQGFSGQDNPYEGIEW
jgi:hypothetical protein